MKADDLPASDYSFELRFETDLKQMYRNVQVSVDHDTALYKLVICDKPFTLLMFNVFVSAVSDVI